ncbi:hypothetical protein CYMTET_12257 [Cymbomonas tetramitiformis]|uniref:S-formylglutathione hydrolase n=1 Tax=Cymbomonas tetramitiformis TaxID=36881 RepID=A0AAE0GL05_9CHLO|nr:hypothetical protein CYMTET_12257 [Cymbomonas tetramitiformis]
MAEVKEIGSTKMFEGFNKRYSHMSASLSCEMKFHVYLPPAAASGKVPVIYYLSGLTCTDENFITKSCAQRMAAELGIALIAPDTSPRGHGVEGEADSYDFGVGAGFYVNATVDKWKNWRMYEYVTEELPSVLGSFDMLDLSKSSIMGHSMGGHGALTIGLKNAGKYKSISAFSPICNPMDCPWGLKALSGYLGDDKESWKEYDACELLKGYSGPKLPLLVDQGTADNFLVEQLKPENLQAACTAAEYPATIRMQEGYDHSYFFISTFIADHIKFHADALSK